jgi:hypothetical protein
MLGNAFYGKPLRIQGYNARLSVASGRLWESGLPETIEERSAVIAGLRSAQHLTLDFFDEERRVRIGETQSGGRDAMAFDALH